jgi:hypothetical protein
MPVTKEMMPKNSEKDDDSDPKGTLFQPIASIEIPLLDVFWFRFVSVGRS